MKSSLLLATLALAPIALSNAGADVGGALGTTAAWTGPPLPDDASAQFAVSYHDILLGGVEEAGVGLRSLGRGTLTLDDVPAGAEVLKAFLYWEILDNAEQASFAQVTFDGQAVDGQRIGTGPGLCWGPASTFAYRADVTALVHGPGDYALADVDSGRTDGADVQSPAPVAEGASLVVAWRHPLGAVTEVTVVDGFEALIGNSATFTIPVTTLPPVPMVGHWRLAVLGGDGQSNAATEFTRVNGVQVAVDTWDGSDPQVVPDYAIGNLWDTDAFDVTAQVRANQPTRVVVQSVSDCLGPAAFVLTQRLG